jgi:hypothetical protein
LLAQFVGNEGVVIATLLPVINETPLFPSNADFNQYLQFGQSAGIDKISAGQNSSSPPHLLLSVILSSPIRQNGV